MSSARNDAFDKLDALRKSPLFEKLSAEGLQSIARRTTTKHFAAGQVLFSEFDEASALYIIVRGRIRSVRQNSGGREQVLSTEEAGAVLALAPLFNSGRFYSTIIADTDADILCISRNEMRAFCQEHPEIFWTICKLFAHKIRAFSELIESLALRNVDQRVAQHLLAVCRERGKMTEQGCTVELQLTQSEMASRVGSTREVVSRALSQIQQRGLINLKHKKLTVPDIAKLRNYAGVDQRLENMEITAELSSEIA